MSKIKDPKQSKPVMGVTPDDLVAEFLKIDRELQQVTQLIEMAQNTMAEQKRNGQILVGKLDILARQLNGMGIDPRNYAPKPSVETPQEADFSPEIEENEAQVIDIKEDPRKKALASRFNR